MANFYIHEDIGKENKIFPKKEVIEKGVDTHPCKIQLKNKNVHKKTEANCLEKKSFFDNRLVLQPKENKKFVTKISINLKRTSTQKKHEKNTKPLVIEGSFLEIQKENSSNHNNKEEDIFPTNLLSNAEYRELFRHGNRTPSGLTELYPNDPHLNFTYFPYGYGQLTSTGKLKLYTMGVSLRNRYNSFMGKYYYPEIVEAITTDYNRTKMSLELVLAGLFPPRQEDLMTAGLTWQPVPYNFVPRSQDKEIWVYLQNLENEMPPPNPSYMTKQKQINWESRSILVDWLAGVSEEYHFSDESFHLGVNYIDRFLSQVCVARNKFQLLGASAMMLATKMEEYYPLDSKEWAFLTQDTFTSKQVLKMEQVILNVLNFKMQTPTINYFIELLATEHKMDEKTVHLAKYIGEMVLLEGEDNLEPLPSKIASGCVALARYMLWKPVTWPVKLKKVSGYSLKELSPVVQKQTKILKKSPMKPQQTIQSKYKNRKFDKVALLRPRRLMLKDLDEE